MTNDQFPMTNEKGELADFGHWGLVIGHSAFGVRHFATELSTSRS
jgi:hypothetical protein